MESSNQGAGEQLIKDLARLIGRHKLALPALLLLEITRPFSFIAGQGLLLCQPLLGYFVEEPQIGGYAELLADRGNLDLLATHLKEARSDSTNGGKGRR